MTMVYFQQQINWMKMHSCVKNLNMFITQLVVIYFWGVNIKTVLIFQIKSEMLSAFY